VDAAEVRHLLAADDTAVIEEAATALVLRRDVASMALVCEALAITDDDEVGDTLLWVLAPLWKSGDVDVPTLLHGVEDSFDGDARRGANEALRWLGLRS
jgi:hypothetical protein